MAQITVPQPKPEPQTLLEKPFSFAPSIFTTFTALSQDPQPTEPEEKINRILQNLNAQHEAVRKNMLGLIQARSKFLVQKAEAELAALGEASDDNDEDEPEESEKSREEMIRRVRVKMKESSKAENYELKSSSMDSFSRTNEDVETLGTGANVRRTRHRIRVSLSNKLRDLVEAGVLILEAYDTDAASSAKMYKQALERRKERFGSISSAAGAVPSPADAGAGGSTSAGGFGSGRINGGGGGFGSGILRNGQEQSPLDLVAIRRMSTGMPVARSPVQPVRTFESVEDVVRRGSTSK